MSRSFHRPSLPGDAHIEARIPGVDPGLAAEAADHAATLLVRGARSQGDSAVADRLVRLAQTEGMETLADVWSGSPADSLAGCLWRLYLLHTWVHQTPIAAADQFAAGRTSAQFARVVAGVADPPGPAQLRAMVDEVLRGIATRDFADVLFQAAAFARVVAAGRAVLETPGSDAAAMLRIAEQLESAGHQELAGQLA